MKRFNFGIIFLFCAKVLSWGEIGHEVVAQIAWTQFSLDTQRKINQLLALTSPFYEENKTFVTASKWPDLIRDGLFGYEHWHYIDQPYKIPPFQHAPKPHQTNIHYGLCQATKSIKESNRQFDKAWMIPMLIHLVGDVHQPLHTASLYSKKYPKGDQGGNLYKILIDNKPIALHLFWDLGLGLLGDPLAAYAPNKTENPETKKIAEAWSKELPKSYFKNQIENLNFESWIKNGYELAKTIVYKTPENTKPSAAYIASGQKLIKERVVLAGYRLGYLLEILLQKKELPDLSCKTILNSKK